MLQKDNGALSGSLLHSEEKDPLTEAVHSSMSSDHSLVLTGGVRFESPSSHANALAENPSGKLPGLAHSSTANRCLCREPYSSCNNIFNKPSPEGQWQQALNEVNVKE